MQKCKFYKYTRFVSKVSFPLLGKVEKSIYIQYFYITFSHIHHYEQCIYGNVGTILFKPSVYQDVFFNSYSVLKRQSLRVSFS